MSFSSATEYPARSPSEDMEASPSGDLNREGSGALPQVGLTLFFLAWPILLHSCAPADVSLQGLPCGQGSGAEARLSVPILERVRALEERIPGLEAKLHPQGSKDRGRAAASSSSTLVGRVEVLEEAMDALLRAQVQCCLLISTQAGWARSNRCSVL